MDLPKVIYIIISIKHMAEESTEEAWVMAMKSISLSGLIDLAFSVQ